eukprot:INCI19108.21.p2 GENE.INCI19108.21~~INCI19108.21.p2  ORF type:complete len:119 (+),score=15.91 INCI19108.21:236-592(+)
MTKVVVAATCRVVSDSLGHLRRCGRARYLHINIPQNTLVPNGQIRHVSAAGSHPLLHFDFHALDLLQLPQQLGLLAAISPVQEIDGSSVEEYQSMSLCDKCVGSCAAAPTSTDFHPAT